MNDELISKKELLEDFEWLKSQAAECSRSDIDSYIERIKNYPAKEIEKIYLKQQNWLEEKRRCEEEIEQARNKLSELLSYVTGGRFSKPSYTIEDMKRFADDYQQDECAKCKLQMGEWSSEEG